MILVDANLLIYAFIEEFPQHKAAKSWLDGRLNSTDLPPPRGGAAQPW